MARPRNLAKMSHAELVALRGQVEKLIPEKAAAERSALRQKLTELARSHGFDISDLLNGRRKGGRKGKVAAKYRDPKNRQNTWTGRGRMPLWLVAATKGGKAKKEDFLIK